MIEFDDNDDFAIPEDKIDVDHDDSSKMWKGLVQDWTDVEQVMVVPGCMWTITYHLNLWKWQDEEFGARS